METSGLDPAVGRGVADGLGRVDLSEAILFLEPESSPLSWLSRSTVRPLMPRGWFGGGWAELAVAVERYTWEPDYGPVMPWAGDTTGPGPTQGVDPLVRTRIFDPVPEPGMAARDWLHDPSPAVGSRAWWEGEALESERPYTQMFTQPWPRVSPEEDAAWDEFARRNARPTDSA